MIFWSVTFKYRHYDDSTYVELIPEYFFTKDKIKEHRQAMESRVKKLARQAEKLDEKGKELYIHDFISLNWPQAVLQVCFAEGTGQETVEMEEADVKMDIEELIKEE